MADKDKLVMTESHGMDHATGNFHVNACIQYYLMGPEAIARLCENIAELLARKYVEDNYGEIVKNINPRAVANLMMIEAGRVAAGKLNGR